jgi:hypothetical protein
MDEKMYILQEKFSPFRGTIQLVSFLFQVKMPVRDARCVAPALSAEDKTCENSMHLQQSAMTLRRTPQSAKSEAIIISQDLLVCIIQILHVSCFSFVK